MFNIVLYQPEIPPNTGNIIRLCANTGCSLHLVEPLAFNLDHSRLKRAGLDYHEFVGVTVHASYAAMLASLGQPRVIAFSTRGNASHASIAYEPGDVLLFGSETRGLPPDILNSLEASSCLRLPMLPGQRSLNLSNAAAVVVYEAWRQWDFSGAS
ncbi:MAG TPA: tRNA (cytidine(34)-2'-O)-methyltransferase [Thiolapillus brandeum]|uniref:tRNA (cytidine(34)-2'-O)-methyltransferase n=1 Tax=Thiolapillus brandeum TaxID=1076588 RepID=A0A831K1N3_9GAMM|nr:tRNA (cytidine(34)-2'-O)-methyltransferase [Thiolapillus brandeum]